MPCRSTARMCLKACFNPRLPLLGGDAPRLWNMPVISLVSIHASRCWEAMHGNKALKGGVKDVSIHASRCWEAMLEASCGEHEVRRFQSTPPVAGRRCKSPSSSRATVNRFNPRLPLLGGDAYRLRHGVDQQNVSIHASRCWEAMRRPRGITLSGAVGFQSTPPVAGRRCTARLASR